VARSFVTKMAHHVKVKAEDQQSSSPHSAGRSAAADDDADDEESLLAQLCPQFVWSVRDFTLQLDLDGKQATPDEYLERCLQEKPGKDEFIIVLNLHVERCHEYVLHVIHCVSKDVCLLFFKITLS